MGCLLTKHVTKESKNTHFPIRPVTKISYLPTTGKNILKIPIYLNTIHPSPQRTKRTELYSRKTLKFTQRGFQNPRTRPGIHHPRPGKEQPPHHVGVQGIRKCEQITRKSMIRGSSSNCSYTKTGRIFHEFHLGSRSFPRMPAHPRGAPLPGSRCSGHGCTYRASSEKG